MPTRALEPFDIGDPAAPVGLAPLVMAAKRRSRLAVRIIGGASILVMILMGGFTWRLHHGNASRPTAYSAQDRRRPVLPFENSSGDPAQDGLAARLTRELTDTIAMDAGVPIIARARSAVDQGSAVDLRSIGREHDVHFVLSGHAQRQGGPLSQRLLRHTMSAPCGRRFMTARIVPTACDQSSKVSVMALMTPQKTPNGNAQRSSTQRIWTSAISCLGRSEFS